MAEEKISLAVLINNENIPTEIFTFSVDKYFGPQIEDFSKSSLVICILSDATGWVPAEDNVATYIKSQWLFMTTFAENDIFEFKIAICDNRDWSIIAEEDKIGSRQITTYHIECEKVFLIRINWNEKLSFSIESITDLYSMDESFLKSHYECTEIFDYDNNHPDFMETIQNLDTIKEDDDNESLNDSLQEISKSEEKNSICESVYSVKEKTLEFEEDSLGNSQNNLNEQKEIESLFLKHKHTEISVLDKIIDETSKNSENELSSLVLLEDEKHDSINASKHLLCDNLKESNDINTNFCNDTSSDFGKNLPFENNENISPIRDSYFEDRTKEMSVDGKANNMSGKHNDEILISDNVTGLNDANLNYNDFEEKKHNNESQNETVTADVNLEEKNSCPQQSKIKKLKEMKEARLLKIQSLLGVKSELQTIQNIEVEKLNKLSSKLNAKCEIIDPPCLERISNFEPIQMYNAETKVCKEVLQLATSNKPEISFYEDRNSNRESMSMDSLNNLNENTFSEYEIRNTSEDKNQEFCDINANNQLNVGILNDEFCKNEHFSDMVDEIEVTAEVFENANIFFIPQIKKTLNFMNSCEIQNKNFDLEDKICQLDEIPHEKERCIKGYDNFSNELCEENKVNKNIELNLDSLTLLDYDSIDEICDKDNHIEESKHVKTSQIPNFDEEIIIDVTSNNETSFPESQSESNNIIPTFDDNIILSEIRKDKNSPKDVKETMIFSNENINNTKKQIIVNMIEDNIYGDTYCENENIEAIQPKVEDVVEMFEKLVLEGEPPKCTKRYKVENENFNKLKQKFETETNENEDKLPLIHIEDTNKIEHTNESNTIKQEDNENEHNERMNDTHKNVLISVLDSEKNYKHENKENEIFKEATKLEHVYEVKEINEIGRNLSIKDIKRIVKEKRERLAVNDDYKYPDSVTPTKVEHDLSKSPKYNVPFMDDEAFYNESWYEESDDRWTSLERTVMNDQDISILTPGNNKECNVEHSTSQTSVISKASIEIFKETEENKSQIDDSIKKVPKRKGLISFCGCVGGR